MADLADSTVDLVKGFEGCILNAYLLEGKPHIGYGFTYYQSGWLIKKFGRSNIRLGDKITQDEANSEIEIILNTFADYVNSVVKVEVSQNQFDALVSLCYNIGKGAFAESDLLKFLNQGDYSGASEQFSRWVYSNGAVNKGLVDRRAKERALFGGNQTIAGSNIILWILIGIVLYKILNKK